MPSENKPLEEKKPKRTHSDKELLKFLWSFVTPYSKMLVFLSFLLLCNVAFVIVGPIFFQKALDYIQRADVLNPTLKMILPPLIAYFIFSIMSWLAYTTQRMFSAKFNVRITNDLRIHIFNEIIENNLTFFHHSESGKLTSRITNDIQEMNDTGDRFMRIFTNLIRLVVIIIILIIYSVPLTLSAFIFLPLVFLISFLLRKYLRKYERKWRKNFASVNQQFSESMRSIAICKSFAREDTNIQKIKKLNEKTYRSSIKRAFGIFIMGPIGDFFRHLLLIIILTVGVIILNKPNSSLTVAGLYLFIFLLDYFYFPVLG
ncbi:MAG: ABC transporter transmembrane domain-containing protein, partial [Promethearchaeota archaeon]